MASKNKHQVSSSKTTFSVANEAIFPNLKTLNTIRKDHIPGQTNLSSTESIAGINQTAIKKIESDLKLTFLSEKDENSLVCMANSPEVRDDFKDVFDFKDLRNYIFAISQSPNVNSKHKNSSEIKTFEIPYPKTTDQFWKLVNLGSKLRFLKLQDSEKNTDQETTAILNEIAKLTSDFF